MSVEVLGRAIERLEELKAGAAGLPWTVVPHYYEKEAIECINGANGVEAVCQLGCGCCAVGLEGTSETFELIVALSRTVDPLISFLSQAKSSPVVTAIGYQYDFRAVALARAVLGEDDEK